ncbi:acyl carrier protein [Sinomonas sp. JGH33]|uniref:Acyl carrier protein n=1 Tax=Sinomonas terricola TaxID=3110330 RepID=A0ABU5T6Q6_9MICC|nr:acyl carrier protein [Sinomonas sp. JGH33]MEA5455189.1 acyl carrier protein [Sinomonas sp. JGH33]
MSTPINPSSSTNASDDIRELLVRTISTELGIAPHELATDRTFASHGVDSITAMYVAVVIEDTLGIRDIPPTLMWDAPTVDQLVPALEALREAQGQAPEEAAA